MMVMMVVLVIMVMLIMMVMVSIKMLLLERITTEVTLTVTMLVPVTFQRSFCHHVLG